MYWAVGMNSSLKWNSYTLQLTERMDRLPRANLISDHPLLGWCKKDPSCQVPVIAQGWNPWLGTFTSRAGNGRTHSRVENRDRRLVLCQNLREKDAQINKDLWKIKEKSCYCSVPASSSRTALSLRKRQMVGQLVSKACAAASVPSTQLCMWELQVIRVDLGYIPTYYSATDESLYLNCSWLWNETRWYWCRHAGQMHRAALDTSRHFKCIYLTHKVIIK